MTHGGSQCARGGGALEAGSCRCKGLGCSGKWGAVRAAIGIWIQGSGVEDMKDLMWPERGGGTET